KPTLPLVRRETTLQLYTLYPCKSDGASETFVVFELADDAQALVHALHVLDQHPTASSVVAWAGERKVLTRERTLT
ncbi:MAG TPA: hypothetical protein VF495_06355, partial [Phenylobacterium sp.]